MTKEQMEILESAIKNLPKETWWDCDGCPAMMTCNDSIPVPPCEVALFEAIGIAKILCEK